MPITTSDGTKEVEAKIDGIVALIIALSRVIAGAGLDSGYDARIRTGAEHIIRSL